MEYARLGRTALQVSRLCLGTMNFGLFTSERDSFAILDRALDAEINFIDTADEYGRKLGEGVTETLLGRWFAQGSGRREKVVLATKVYQPMGDWPNESGLSARHIRQACDASLRRLKTDYLDLYQMHHVDWTAPWDEIWQAMEHLVSQGKVLYVGSSNFPGWQIARANETAQHRHFLGLVSEQSLYNLTARMVELEVIPACGAYGVALLPWSPLARGMLTGIPDDFSTRPRTAEVPEEKLARGRSQVQKYTALCSDLGAHPAAVALAWLLHQPAVVAPVIGPRTLDHLETALPAVGINLPENVLHELDVIFPGPGGRAPEAYAW
ncbi:MAG TPA: aldo/keto reductase [Chloroflexota bacterium]|nr:aldo/keto reductase [Chloroflexota bacterium]